MITSLPHVGSCICPLFVAEKFVSEKFFAEYSTVYSHQEPIAAFAVVVDELGQKLFAGPRIRR